MPLQDNIAEWMTQRHHAVLITIRRDGSPQSSNISYDFADGVARVSVTADRAKVKNLQRDPRGILHVLGENFWQYASVQVGAELSEVSTAPGDATGVALLDLLERINGKPHPDPQEFFEAMVTDRRQLLTLRPISATSSGID
jgi:PPOX class probable F420-dependent enzyme